MALAALPGLGPVNLRRLEELMEDPLERLLEMDLEEQRRICGGRLLEEVSEWRNYFDPERVAEQLERMGADFVTWEEAGYPSGLGPYADRPVGLYRYGAGKVLEGRCLAMVGTRQPTGYGRKVAREWAACLARAGLTIVSGMAEGIDTEVHRAVLEAGGRTAAILGGGLCRCYPPSNRSLMEAISRSAGVWTEFPLWRRADRRSFPQRNRIVSGVSEGVVVVESGPVGGSLITARMASEQGKSVYVVPGRVDSPQSAGCHALIRDGACLVSSPEDVLEDLRSLPLPMDAGQGDALRNVTPPSRAPTNPQQARLWEVLEPGRPAHPDQVAEATALPVSSALQILLELELDGRVCRRLDGSYERL